MISVVIATRNRPDAMAQYILPSLAQQSYREFEVIIVDASDDDNTRIIAEKYEKNRVFSIRWLRALAKGIPSQRNQGVREAHGSIIAFFDDDSELSEDSLQVLSESFMSEEVGGVGLYISNLHNQKRLHLVIEKVFMLPGAPGNGRVALRSGFNTTDIHDTYGLAQWLSGCSMSFRRCLFDEGLQFNEKLQRFGGYAVGEDFEFSHKVFLKGWELLVTDRGALVHHVAPGGRHSGKVKSAAEVYNHCLIRRELIAAGAQFSFYRHVFSLFGLFLVDCALSIKYSSSDFVRGFFLGLSASTK